MTSSFSGTGQPIVQIDAFTDTPFRGNPAAVCLLPGEADESWMQLVALEMNLAETAFLYPSSEGSGCSYHLRWFTPGAEVKLCGHATVASAHHLYEDGMVPRSESISFSTLSGALGARCEGEKIILDFPSNPPVECDVPQGLAEALHAEPKWVGQTPAAFLVQLESEHAVRLLDPDLNWIGRQPGHGVIVTAKSDDNSYDFVSRFFAPTIGVPEDPVTGSAHCSLTPFWAQRLGKTEMVAYQASPRGGTVGVALHGDRVELTGSAVTVMRGVLLF